MEITNCMQRTKNGSIRLSSMLLGLLFQISYSQNETSETSDNDSVTLDYTCVDNVLSPDSETASSTQDSIISNSVPLKESNVSSQLSQRESDKKPFVSPILERCARQSMKRTQSDQSVVLGYSV